MRRLLSHAGPHRIAAPTHFCSPVNGLLLIVPCCSYSETVHAACDASAAYSYHVPVLPKTKPGGFNLTCVSCCRLCCCFVRAALAARYQVRVLPKNEASGCSNLGTTGELSVDQLMSPPLLAQTGPPEAPAAPPVPVLLADTGAAPLSAKHCPFWAWCQFISAQRFGMSNLSATLPTSWFLFFRSGGWAVLSLAAPYDDGGRRVTRFHVHVLDVVLEEEVSHQVVVPPGSTQVEYKVSSPSPLPLTLTRAEG